MALITQIRRSSRTIRCHKRTTMEINFDHRIFSIWTIAAGAESGMDLSPANIQMNREQAALLRNYLNEFLQESQQDT